MTHILILERRPERVREFRKLLEPKYQLTFADSVRVAIDAAKREKFILFMSALHLDSNDGADSVFDFLRAVKADPQSKRTPFFFCCLRPSHLSETIADAMETSARALGADYFELVEVCDYTEVAQRITDAIEKGRF